MNKYDTLKRLIEYTKEKPVRIDELFEKFEYATGFPDVLYSNQQKLFLISNYVVFSIPFLRKHTEYTLKNVFKNENKILMADFFSKFNDLLEKIYGVSINEYDISLPAEIKTELQIEYGPMPIQYGEYFLWFFRNFLSDILEKYQFELKFEKGYFLPHIVKRFQKPFIFGAIKTFLDNEKNTLSIDDFIYSFPFDDFEIVYPLSDKGELIAKLSKYPDYFEVVENKIILKDFFTPVVEHLNTKYFSYNEISKLSNSGLVAIILNGGYSFFGEAEEFVKIRKIIDVFPVENFEKELNNYFEPKELKANELNGFLFEKLELRNDKVSFEKYIDWMKENLRVSFFECDVEKAKLLEFTISLKNMPLLKTDPVYDNVFSELVNKNKENFEKILSAEMMKNGQ